MPEPTWKTIRARAGEFHSTEYRGMKLDVVRTNGQAIVVGSVFTESGDRLERFSACCTVDQAKARCVRVADRWADEGDD